jgi:spermidine synthase
MKDSITAENSDFQPSCLYYNLAYMNALYSKNSGMIFSFLNRISLQWIAVSFLVILFVLFLVSLKWKKFAEKSINFSIFSTGIAGMWINLIIIFSFQIFFGFLFHQLGLLISVFMLGIGAGGFIVLKYCRKLKEVKLFLILEGLLTVFPVFMIMLFFVFKDIGQDFSYSAVFSTAFLSGFLIGAEFPLAGRIHANIRQEQKITTAGSLYGADLSGGFLGSISGSVILFPVIGIFQTCVAIMLLKLISFVFFARFTRVYK